MSRLSGFYLLAADDIVATNDPLVPFTFLFITLLVVVVIICVATNETVIKKNTVYTVCCTFCLMF